MKKTYQRPKWTLWVAVLTLVAISACKDDYPTSIDSPHQVELASIKILNAGADGNTVVTGVVDESQKRVTFPRLDPETDFSALRFEIEGSAGANLEQEVYEVPFLEGESERTIVVKLVNESRFREYFLTIRILVPVFGADFEQPQVFDFSNNSAGQPTYPTFVSLLTRGSGFDGEHVLVVTRAEGGSHLLAVEDLKNDQINPIPLNMTGVAGGTLPVNCGAQVNGHTYIASLSGGQVSPFKIYHWADPNAAPDVIADINIATIPNAGARHGDNMSVNLDQNGNGYMYFGDNAATSVLRLKVTNYTTITEPTVFASQTGVTFCMSYTSVAGTDDYIFTGYEAPIMVANESGVVSYRAANTAFPLRGSDARVVTFNEERYLIMTTAARSGDDATVLYVYDITRGDNVAEALSIFEESGGSALFSYALGGPTNAAPSTQTGWYVAQDEEGNDASLMLYTATADAGFVLLEFPKKELDD